MEITSRARGDSTRCRTGRPSARARRCRRRRTTAGADSGVAGAEGSRLAGDGLSRSPARAGGARSRGRGSRAAGGLLGAGHGVGSGRSAGHAPALTCGHAVRTNVGAPVASGGPICSMSSASTPSGQSCSGAGTATGAAAAGVGAPKAASSSGAGGTTSGCGGAAAGSRASAAPAGMSSSSRMSSMVVGSSGSGPVAAAMVGEVRGSCKKKKNEREGERKNGEEPRTKTRLRNEDRARVQPPQAPPRAALGV